MPTLTMMPITRWSMEWRTFTAAMERTGIPGDAARVVGIPIVVMRGAGGEKALRADTGTTTDPGVMRETARGNGAVRVHGATVTGMAVTSGRTTWNPRRDASQAT